MFLINRDLGKCSGWVEKYSVRLESGVWRVLSCEISIGALRFSNPHTEA